MKRILSNFKLLGIAFLVLLMAGVYLTYAVFTKKFTDYEEVTLQTSTIGLQLPTRADVKIRGMIVGEVLEFDTTSEGAELTLGLFPDTIDRIDKDVTAAIVPKTLFGEKYVSLVAPAGPVSDPIQAGDTIERTQVATEVEQVLSDLYPLLRTVQPAQLNMTLNALATALEGRGEQLGENLETVDAYLKKLNPEIPALIEDLRLTADVSDTYADVLPEVAQILDNTVLSTGTLEGREAKLSALFQDLSAFSDTARTFLEDNGDNIVRLGELSAAQLRVLGRYATEIPCLTKGIVKAGKLQAEAFRGFELHIVLETLPRQPRAYNVKDKPRIGDNRGPACLHLPNPPWSQENPVTQLPDFNDGVDEPTGKGTQRVAPGYGYTDDAGLFGYTGSPGDAATLQQMLGSAYDLEDEDGSDLGALLAGPLVGERQSDQAQLDPRGAE